MTRRDVELWQQLQLPESAALIAAAEELDTSHPASIERLGRQWDRDLIAVAIELVRARSKTRGKFPNGGELWADVEGAEQATSHAVAEHKAARFRRLAPDLIYDLCCGIGGDAMSLARAAKVVAIDRDPLRLWMTQQNLACEGRCEDVVAARLHDVVFHIDPSRRGGGRRAWRYRDYQPAPHAIAALLEANGDGAVKLGPGIEFAELPPGGEVEVINEHGTLVQAVLWRGRLAEHDGHRTATRIDGRGVALSISGVPAPPPADEAGSPLRWLVVADPAVERAALVGALGSDHDLAEWSPGLGLLTSDEKPSSPWLTSFEVLEVMPWRPAKVRAWLQARNAGSVAVKTRGKAADANAAQRELSGSGDEPFTVFILRWSKSVRAVLTRRPRS